MHGYWLIKTPEPVASYVSFVQVGNLLYLSGRGPIRASGTYITGKLGDNVSIDSGYYAARLVAIAHLSVVKKALGSLQKVKQIVKVFGMVNATSDFVHQPKVINGYSDLMVAVFGNKGMHALSAVGMASLPSNRCVEVEVIVEVEEVKSKKCSFQVLMIVNDLLLCSSSLVPPF